MLPVIKKNFNARRTLHAAIDTIRAINKLREGGAAGLMEGAMSVDPKRGGGAEAGAGGDVNGGNANTGGNGNTGNGNGAGARGGGGGAGGAIDERFTGQGGDRMEIDSRGNARGQTEEQIREQQRRVEETSRGLWGGQGGR